MKTIFLGIIIVILFAVPTIFPLWQEDYFSSHDSPVHLPRMQLFAEALREGNIPPRWIGSLVNGYGYPLFNFLYSFPSFAGGILILAGMPGITAAELSYGLTMLLAAVGMFLWARSHWGFWGGVLSSIVYTYAPYHAVDLYVRGSLGELWALAWFPWMMWSMDFVIRRRELWSLGLSSLFIGLLILSHNILALMMIPTAGLYGFVLSVLNAERARFLAFLSGTFLLGLLATSFFWMPALMEKDLTIVDEAIRREFYYADHFVYPLQLFRYSPWGYGGSQPGPVDGMSFYLQWPWVIAFIASIIVVLFVKRSVPLIVAIIVTSIAAFLTLTISKPIWDLFTPFAIMQYPWRFLSLVIAMGAFCIGSVVTFSRFFPQRFREFSSITIVFIVLILMIFKTWEFFSLGSPNPETKTFNKSFIQRLTTTYANEHLPVWVKKFPTEKPEHRVELLEGAGVVTVKRDESRLALASVDLTEDSRLRIHKFYYPGWIINVDGKKTDISFDNDFGVMDIYVPQGQHSIEARFGETAFRQTLNTVSLIAFFVVLILLFLPKKRRLEMT